MNAAYVSSPHSNSRKEIILFISCLTIMSVFVRYAAVGERSFFPWSVFKRELLRMDVFFMAIACLPVWWLHFRKWAHLEFEKEIPFLHLGHCCDILYNMGVVIPGL